VWSVGCIFAEILGRRPLFPGKDYLHQLHLILDVLGTPSYEDTEFIASSRVSHCVLGWWLLSLYLAAAQAKAYIRGLPPRQKVPFKKLYPKASEAAIDLLERMLTFAPHKRITGMTCCLCGCDNERSACS
jgi:serine/threonine protein kinase